MDNITMCRLAISLLRELCEASTRLTDDEYASSSGAIIWQEMQDCIEAAFYKNPPDIKKLTELRDSTTNVELHNLLNNLLKTSGSDVDVKRMNLD